MSGNQTVDARAQALMSLIMCAEYIRNRDPIIRRADRAGIPKTEIARIIGLSRQTISGIANREEPGAPQATSPVGDAPAHPKDDR